MVQYNTLLRRKNLDRVFLQARHESWIEVRRQQAVSCRWRQVVSGSVSLGRTRSMRGGTCVHSRLLSKTKKLDGNTSLWLELDDEHEIDTAQSTHIRPALFEFIPPLDPSVVLFAVLRSVHRLLRGSNAWSPCTLYAASPISIT